MKRLLILCGTAALMLVPAAVAAHSQPLSFYTSGYSVFSSTVSQQGGITNPTGCGWNSTDFEDHEAGLNSSLAAGQSVTDTVCLVLDGTPHVVYSQVASESGKLNMTISFTTGQSYTVAPTFDSRLGKWSYLISVPTPVFAVSDASVQPVGSGWGVPMTATMKLSNPTSKAATKVVYGWGYGPQG